MINYMPITDITFTDDFMDDYDRAPSNIKKRTNRLIEMILEAGRLIPSMNARTTFKDDMWMGNITQNRTAWRVIFWIDDETLILHRLLTHDRRDEYLRL